MRRLRSQRLATYVLWSENHLSPRFRGCHFRTEEFGLNGYTFRIITSSVGMALLVALTAVSVYLFLRMAFSRVYFPNHRILFNFALWLAPLQLVQFGMSQMLKICTSTNYVQGCGMYILVSEFYSCKCS